MEITKKLQKRITEEGFTMEFNPPGDGNCFYHAAAHQLGFKADTLKLLIFDYLECHQYDVSDCLVTYFQWLHDHETGYVYTETNGKSFSSIFINISTISPSFMMINAQTAQRWPI